ncbi:MAG: methyltransferase domain-containing protein [Candidatus Freyarchaeota archaeon]
MKKLKLWSEKQKLLREEKFSDYKARIWKMEKWFKNKHGSGLTLSVGGGDSPLGDVSCDPLMPKHIKCVGEYLPFRPKSFETVLVYSVLDHCLDPIKLLRECKNISNKVLIMQTIIPLHIEFIWRINFFIKKRKIPTINNIDPYHMRHYTYHKLKKQIIRSGLRAKSIVMVQEKGYKWNFLSSFIAFISTE